VCCEWLAVSSGRERRRAAGVRRRRGVETWAGTRATMVKGSAGVFEK